ncbi:type II CAAX endopeptidase family protein [Pseudescherichia sp.]|uniref:CPBP family intramembrane glutamic endopeptidase n=1 Tax=Pseudescherichia sp. TaxID=2055881 RepID=UPI00289B76A6|nr:type II CAAX endopeptidase family protein [Pseudescherichia sp.]
MNISGYSSEFTERSKAVTGCFAMFTLFLGITFLPNFYAGSKALLVEGYLYPLLFGLEFMIITPLYYIYFRNREGHGKGQFRSGIFLTLFLCVLFVQFIIPSITAAKQVESWSASQMALESHVFWLNAFMMVLIVPVYEEMVFRGCLFTIFKFWLGNNIYAAGVAVSILFSACHLQYMDWRSFLILFLVSTIFVAGRVITGGIVMPVVLHMMMNLVVIGAPYALGLLNFAD